MAAAEDNGGGEAEIDMETDGDGNGVPDEFEDEFKKLLDTMSDLDAGDANLKDIYDSKPYRAIRDFYERLPIKASTKEGLDEIAADFRDLAAADSVTKHQKAVEQLQEKQEELIDNDRVYKQAVEYIKVLSPANSGEATDAAAGMATASVGNSGDSGLAIQRIQAQSSTARPEDSINQVGDMLFRDAEASTSLGPFYAREWSHIGMYDGPGKIYDSSDQDCAGTAEDDDGVAVRDLQEFYDDANAIMYAQLDNASWRANQAEALRNAKNTYGSDCTIPFNMNPFSMSGTSDFFCSKLVWRAYLDDYYYPVDLDSNSLTYYWWLQQRYGWGFSWYIITHTVAPDEIALSSHVDRYYQRELD